MPCSSPNFLPNTPVALAGEDDWECNSMVLPGRSLTVQFQSASNYEGDAENEDAIDNRFGVRLAVTGHGIGVVGSPKVEVISGCTASPAEIAAKEGSFKSLGMPLSLLELQLAHLAGVCATRCVFGPKFPAVAGSESDITTSTALALGYVEEEEEEEDPLVGGDKEQLGIKV